jgi:hypothetical protein
MSTYYCHSCAHALGHYPATSPESVNLTGSNYQLQKFVKHTTPATGGWVGKNSIYSDPTYETYKNYYVSGSLSGSLEIDAHGRKNVIWYASSSLGTGWRNGTPVFSGDAVKIVLPEDDQKVHHFHVEASGYQKTLCSKCGNPILS